MTFFVDCKCRKCRAHFTGGDTEYDSWIAALRVQPSQAPNNGWWCPRCQCTVPPEHVTFQETHDPRAGGCGGDVFTEPSTAGVPPTDGGQR